MVMLKMLMKIGLPKMRGVLVMTIASISPSGREVPPAESLYRRAKVLLPKFRLKATALRPESPPLIFSRFFWEFIPEDGHQRWARLSTTHQGAPRGPGAPWWVVPTWEAPSGGFQLQ